MRPNRPGRYVVRRPALIPLALVVLLVAEVAAVVAVGRQLGVLPTVLLLLLGSALGGWLLRREGTRAWRALATAVGEGRPPHREALDGVLVLLGGLLVLFPGFVSDVFGLLCLLPPTRALGRRVIGRYLARRAGALGVVQVQDRRGPADPAGPPATPAADRVIEGELDGGDEPPTAGRR
jgi:UPF0716 protein FxsA